MSDPQEDKPVEAAKAPSRSVIAAPRLLPASQLGSSWLPNMNLSNNPFARAPLPGGDCNSSSSTMALMSEGQNSTQTEETNNEKKPEEAPVHKFLPLQSSRESISFAGGTVPDTSDRINTSSNFVFGQNLQDRVMKQNNSVEGTSNNNVEHLATNGTSGFLFSAVNSSTDGQQLKPKESSEDQTTSSSSTWECIPDTPLPPVPPAGPILTGEEGEINVYQVNCRLFAFEGGQWKERGRGQLRLNDSEIGSRLVCRAAGSLRVLLNTKVWGEMTVERAGHKSLRVTATDSQQHVKVFLVMTGPEEIILLTKLLSKRVCEAKEREEKCDEVTDTDAGINVGAGVTSISAPSTDSGSEDADSNTKEVLCPDPEESVQAGNPVVIVSTEDDDDLPQTNILKRPLDSTDHNEQSKKVCTDSIDGGVPEL